MMFLLNKIAVISLFIQLVNFNQQSIQIRIFIKLCSKIFDILIIDFIKPAFNNFQSQVTFIQSFTIEDEA
ncbi:hypothetical protein APD05_19660 [Acinetobacter nosocomialis]|nr:hypothetical protein APD05_19660 [Acinetobacter nosocomialis]RSB93285.1 hypothetical protein EGS33_03275 [Acinetobacter sp. FDAARGOS_541]KQE33041.1 hypothetical protein APD42_16905 [Acinetobacter nosocomialis]KRJ12556.1 hypothetical protein APC77_05400 [Acinetobacter nosocomialis]OTL00443.1 hypothetical protein B9X83_13635 [Acinetobacter nosocomialis]